MAEIHVGENQPYATLARAAAAAKAGDRVVVHEQAVAYREVLRPPAGTTWEAAPGAKPVETAEAGTATPSDRPARGPEITPGNEPKKD